MDTKLSQDGIDQAKQLSKAIDQSKYNLIYSSDLGRAYDTCCESVDKKLIKTDLRLRERSLGICEGKTVDDLKSMAVQAGVSLRNLSTFTPPEGETPEQVGARIKDFYKSIINQTESGWNVLVVTHGGIVRETLRYFKNELNCDFSSFKDKNPLVITPNTGICEIKLYHSNGQLKFAECTRLHDISHLDNKTKSIVLSEKQINDNGNDRDNNIGNETDDKQHIL